MDHRYLKWFFIFLLILSSIRFWFATLLLTLISAWILFNYLLSTYSLEEIENNYNYNTINLKALYTVYVYKSNWSVLPNSRNKNSFRRPSINFFFTIGLGGILVFQGGWVMPLCSCGYYQKLLACTLWVNETSLETL
jgi:hypothetical protein